MIVSRTSFKRVISCTTRPPRVGEIDGVHYHFVSREEYFDLKSQKFFMDEVCVSGQYYALPFQHIVDAVQKGEDVILNLATGSALVLKSIFGFAKLVFILSPTSKDVVNRILNSGMEHEAMQKRLQNDPNSELAAQFYDFKVVNHHKNEHFTTEKILEFVQSEHKNENLHEQLLLSIKRKIRMIPEVFVTTSDEKNRELSAILGFELEKINVDLIEPQGISVEEVSKVKAEEAFSKAGKPALVEDTGLSIDALGGLPGALIKWFMKSMGTAGILDLLSHKENRKAQAITALSYHDGYSVKTFTGTVDGTISYEERGENGFGWDTIFIPDGYTQTFAEMLPEEKNKISQRALAAEALRISIQ